VRGRAGVGLGGGGVAGRVGNIFWVRDVVGFGRGCGFLWGRCGRRCVELIVLAWGSFILLVGGVLLAG